MDYKNKSETQAVSQTRPRTKNRTRSLKLSFMTMIVTKVIVIVIFGILAWKIPMKEWSNSPGIAFLLVMLAVIFIAAWIPFIWIRCIDTDEDETDADIGTNELTRIKQSQRIN